MSSWAVLDCVEVLFDYRLIVTQMLTQPRDTNFCWMRDWRSVEWGKLIVLLWKTLDQNLLSRDLAGAEAVEGAASSFKDSGQTIIDVLVLLERVCRYSRASWTQRLIVWRRRVASAHHKWMRVGRIGAREKI